MADFDQFVGLSNNQLRQKLHDLRGQLEQGGSNEQKRKHEVMELLHEFNDVKDAAQVVLGALANLHGTSIKSMHQKYNLPLNE